MNYLILKLNIEVQSDPLKLQGVLNLEFLTNFDESFLKLTSRWIQSMRTRVALCKRNIIKRFWCISTSKNRKKCKKRKLQKMLLRCATA